jgi:hypothetical protein
VFSKNAAQDLFQDYAAAWRGNAAGDIAAAWDSDRFVLYKAEEVPHFFLNWQQVLEYWRQNERLHERVVLRFSELRPVPLSERLSLVLARMRWDIRFAPDAVLADGSAFSHRGQAMGGDNHVLAILGARRDSPGSWRLRGWSETPDAPISYIRSLYLAQADLTLLDQD